MKKTGAEGCGPGAKAQQLSDLAPLALRAQPDSTTRHVEPTALKGGNRHAVSCCHFIRSSESAHCARKMFWNCPRPWPTMSRETPSRSYT
jgi:hypothetical protein